MLVDIFSSPKPEEDYVDYVSRLCADGAEQIGEGDSASVFFNPREAWVVLKIATTGEGNALAWTKWCYENSTLYTPRVFFVEELPFQASWRVAYYRAFIEMLTPATETDVVNFISHHKLGEVIVRINEPSQPSEWAIHQKHIPTIIEPDLRKVVEKIHELTHLNFADLSVRNFMMRGAQLVFVDPVPY